MHVNPIFIKTSLDTLLCSKASEIPKYVKLIEDYCGFTFKHKELAVTQGSGLNTHKALGVTFEAPIGGAGSADAVCGTIDLVRFDSAIAKLKKTLFSKQLTQFCLFSIVDHNSAHHMSYALAKITMEHLKSSKKGRLFITFDNHTDQHNVLDRKITCQNYVRALFERDLVDGVLHVGWSFPEGEENLKGVNYFERQNFTTNAAKGMITSVPEGGSLLEQIKAKRQKQHPKCRVLSGVTAEDRISSKINAKKFDYAYVTVDRDFMKCSFTPYGDGENHPDKARNIVKFTLDKLASADIRLMGFDITGMPCVTGRSKCTEEGTLRSKDLSTGKDLSAIPHIGTFDRTKREAIIIALQDILFYYKLVCSYTFGY